VFVLGAARPAKQVVDRARRHRSDPALLEEGRDAEAAKVVAAHRAGVAAAMAYVEREAAYVRSGYHGKTLSG
jgi:hypothetical protein